MRTSTENVQSLDDSRQNYHHKLAQVDKKYTMMSSATKRQVTAILQDEVDFLNSRKQRSIIKKQQIKQLEANYQREREERIKKMTEKAQKSQVLHQQQVGNRKKRVKQSMEHVDKVNRKVHREHQQELEKMLQLRHQYKKKQDSVQPRQAMTGSRSHHNSGAHTRRGNSLYSVGEKMNMIEERLSKARTNSEFYHRQISDRAKIYSQNNGILEKVRTRSAMEENHCLEDYYKRATHLLQRQQEARHQIEKQVEKRRKSSGQKLKKWQENVGYLDQARQTKYQQLINKHKQDKQSLSPESKREEKNKAYLQRVQKHQAELELMKERKAEEILKKHLDMTLRNRALKEKKEKIIQTMKRGET